MSLDWKVRPIETWPRPMTKSRKSSPFRTTKQVTYGEGLNARTVNRSESGANWRDTMQLLERELRMLGAKTIILQMAVTERDCRNDGWIRADARPQHPGVILSFESKHGPLSYPCDAFTDWQSNVRAIALALEALRMVDRYGVTARGEQYQGFGRIAAKSTVSAPEKILAQHSGMTEDEVRADPKAAYRRAALATHPDRGGQASVFSEVADAARILGAL